MNLNVGPEIRNSSGVFRLLDGAFVLRR